MRATRRQAERLLGWAEPFEKRTWAIESAGGLGYLLAQQLVAQGEKALDVPATLASRIRVLATGRSNKNDPNDALSVAIVAFRAPNLRSIESADHGEVLRLLAKRNGDLGSHRTRVVCRLHALLAELAPAELPRKSTFRTPSDSWPRSRRRLPPSRSATTSPSSSSTMCAGSMPRPRSRTGGSESPSRPRTPRSSSSMGSARLSPRQLIGYSGDVRHFANRDAFASYNKPKRKPCVRASFRSLRLPTAAPRRPIGGPGGDSGTTPCLRDRLFTLRDRFFGEVTPEPMETLRRCVLL